MKYIIPLLLATIILGVHSQAQAAAYRTTEKVTIPSGETLNDDLYAAGESVTIDGTVNGDLVVAGGHVTINGTVTGDLVVAGGDVVVKGAVNDDIRAAGGTITVSSKVGDDLLAAGGSITVGPEAVVGGDVKASGGEVTFNGAAQSLQAATGQLRLGKTAKISSGLTYISNNNAAIESGATIAGTVDHREGPQFKETPQDRVWKTVAAGLLLALFAYLFTLVFPQKSQKLAHETPPEWASALVWGFVFLIAVPFVSVLAILTFIAAPLGVLALTLYAIALGFAKLATTLFVGSKVMGLISKDAKQPSLAIVAVVGALVLTVLMLIPVVGPILSFILFLIGLGALLRFDWQLYTKLRADKQI